MTQDKHMPGPWVASEQDNGEWVIEAADRHVNDWVVAIVCDNCGDSSTEANARLIAAAPEMLEVLRDLLDAIERDIPDAVSITTGPMQAARAAIVKATGA